MNTYFIADTHFYDMDIVSFENRPFKDKDELNNYIIEKWNSKVTKDDEVLDLYSGIGTISLFLSKYAKNVLGIEVVKEAVVNAKENIKLNNIKNASFILDDARNPLDKYLVNKDVVIVDPPRKGLNEGLINSLINSKIKTVLYVSCNPATLARDLSILKDYYNISSITPVDLFPYTIHVECVTCLMLK